MSLTVTPKTWVSVSSKHKNPFWEEKKHQSFLCHEIFLLIMTTLSHNDYIIS